jgi:uncharacterized protein YrrD
MNVIGVEGQKAGEVDRVVIDPRDGRVTDIIVRSGFLFPTDKVIPVDLVSHTTEDELKLKVMADEAKGYPDFIETTYIPVDEHALNSYGYGSDATLPTPYYWYPYIGSAAGTWGGTPSVGSNPDAYTYPLRETKEMNIPRGTVALKEGARVTGVDGKQVGDLERVITDNEKDKITHLVISKAGVNKERKLVPASWISHVESDSVELAVDANFIDTLRDYKEE